MTPFFSRKVWTQALDIDAATARRLTKIYVTVVVCVRSHLEKRDGLGPTPDQAFHPPAGICPGSDQLLSRAGMDERDTATRCSR
jgi:hypothetical protein